MTLLAFALGMFRSLDRVAAVVLRLPIRLYRRLLSPALPPSCRFHPSCSLYADEALALHGAVHGSALAAHRLLRCHPFAEGGLDPVPPAPEAHTPAGPEVVT